MSYTHGPQPSHTHMGHGSHASQPVAPGVRNVIVAVIVPFILATIAGLVLLWPTGDTPTLAGGVRADATILTIQPCDDPDAPDETISGDECRAALVQIESGPDEGVETTAFMPYGEGAPEFEAGDGVVLLAYPDAELETRYEISDFQRGTPLLVLAIMFALAILALSRWRGLGALTGLGFSILVLTIFVLPALLGGRPPLAVAVVGASAIMVGTMYLTHGISVRTSVALLGTLISLSLTGLLGFIFTAAGQFTGLADESAGFLGALGDAIDIRGLLLAGLVIGALGVLDDVTVTQTIAVWELAAADPNAGRRALLAAGMRIGREHVGATVNTLVLAYAGASLPLLMLFIVADQGALDIATSEQVAQEVVRALVGSLGIVAAVPVTTVLAAFAVRATTGPSRGRRRSAVTGEG